MNRFLMGGLIVWLRAEHEKWSRVVRETGATVN